MIINKKKILSEQEIYCKNTWSQATGLMFRRRQNLVMEFSTPRKISLHMWFVKFPIDVLVLDDKKKVVDIKRNFQPWTFWNSSYKGKYIVELGASNSQVEIGDILEFRN